MPIKITYQLGETPLDANEMNGLLVPTIASRSELDEYEQLNIQEALNWSIEKRFTVDSLLTEKGLTTVHKKMFDHVWSWAGKFRQSEKIIGIEKELIPKALQELCTDTKYWIAHETYPPDEIAIRFKHILVSIHPFPNGNGRYSRLMADILVSHFFGRDAFTWGKSLGKNARDMYINALRWADQGDI